MPPSISKAINCLITECMPSREGSPNKNKQYLMKRLQDMYGEDFHPIMNMAKNCVVLQKIADDHANGKVTVSELSSIDATSSAKNANDAWEKVAQYVEPKLKAVETSHDLTSDLKAFIKKLSNKSDDLPDDFEELED